MKCAQIARSLAAVLLLAGTLSLPASARSEEQIRLAVDAAARHLQVEPAAVQVLRVEEVEWSDSSLGCPQPGRFYLQVITPGWLAELAVGDRVLEFHGSAAGQLVLCGEHSAGSDGSDPVAPAPDPGEERAEPEPLTEDDAAPQ